MLTNIPFNSPVSFLTAANPSFGKNPDSPGSSSQYSVSSNSCNDPSILLMESALDLARVASQYCAPTDVPDLSNWRPISELSRFDNSQNVKMRVSRCFPIHWTPCLETLRHFENSRNVEMR